jgi:GntR family transcriptional regulator, transcriptional repressor for pyruvate dehydrogenase complex
MAGSVTTGDRQALLRAMLERIDEARVAPETRLPGERELANAFGASRTAVREVLGVLEAMRVIERRPQSGIYVRPAAGDASIEALVLREGLDLRPNTTSYEQAQEARVIHEVEAARLAAKRRTRMDLAIMQDILDRSRGSLDEGRNLADEDEAFHLALIEAAQNDILLRMAKSLYLMTRSVRRAYFQAQGHAAASIEEHVKLLQSVEQRDAELAATLMKKHYASSSARWRRAFAHA